MREENNGRKEGRKSRRRERKVRQETVKDGGIRGG